MTDLTAPAGPARDRWGRPLITPPDGGKQIAYTRATTLAGTLDDMYGLMGWKQRMTALGIAARQDLLLAVQAVNDPDRQKKQLNQICDQALEAAQASKGATVGTAWHALTDRIDDGDDLPPGLDPDTVTSLEAYRQATDHVTFTHTEQFLVCDDLQAAGTADRIAVIDGVPTIWDLKTGKTLKYDGVKIAIQLAVYAHGQLYDHDTGVRTPLDGIDLTRAVVCHLPSNQPGTCTLHWVDIDAGWKLAQLAADVRAARKRKGLIANAGPGRPPASLEQAIADCRTVAELEQLWSARQDEWTEHHTSIARGHKQFLASHDAA